MPTYQPKIRYSNKDYPCRVCREVKEARDMLITGIDGNNYAITQNAVKNPICTLCQTEQLKDSFNK